MNKLTEYVDAFRHLKIGVLGDVMLDKYIWGSASRISPEAPVPIVQVRKETSVPGGAANVARNVLSLGAGVKLFGTVGNDAIGDELLAHLSQAGADLEGVLHLKDRATTSKTRVLAGTQQVCRIDQEDTAIVTPAVHGELRRRMKEAFASGEIRALILEDYAKGLFGKSFMQNVINDAAKYGIITTLDPHPNNMYNAKGLFLMTPNRREAFALGGVKYASGIGNPAEDKPLRKVAQNIMRLWHPQHLLITLGAEGMALFSENMEEPLHIPTKARQVFDVSGAGDTVMATIVLALLAGASTNDAAVIANHAAGIVVGMVGTAAIEAQVLKDSLNNG